MTLTKAQQKPIIAAAKSLLKALNAAGIEIKSETSTGGTCGSCTAWIFGDSIEVDVFAKTLAKGSLKNIK